MYAAKYEVGTDSVRYTFEASGSLWKDALVMRDRQTGSLWSQVYGVGIDGDRKGDTLELFPSEFITFGALREKYPDAKILKKAERAKPGSHYQRYFSDPDRIGIFGHTFDSDELPAKALVLGVRNGAEALAVAIDGLTAPTLVQVDFAAPSRKSALIYYDPDPEKSEAFALEYDNSVIGSGDLVVVDGSTVELKGEKLTLAELSELSEFNSLPLVTAYWFAWKSFFPSARIVSMTAGE